MAGPFTGDLDFIDGEQVGDLIVDVASEDLLAQGVQAKDYLEIITPAALSGELFEIVEILNNISISGVSIELDRQIPMMFQDSDSFINSPTSPTYVTDYTVTPTGGFVELDETQLSVTIGGVPVPDADTVVTPTTGLVDITAFAAPDVGQVIEADYIRIVEDQLYNINFVII